MKRWRKRGEVPRSTRAATPSASSSRRCVRSTSPTAVNGVGLHVSRVGIQCPPCQCRYLLFRHIRAADQRITHVSVLDIQLEDGALRLRAEFGFARFRLFGYRCSLARVFLRWIVLRPTDVQEPALSPNRA
jgi:hypothetical protein